MKYYFYRCYFKENQPASFLYTIRKDTVVSYTGINLAWCKKWKTLAGAKRNFEKYSQLWLEAYKEGFLEIEECEWE